MHQLSDRPDSFQVSSTPPLRKSDRPKRSQNHLVSLLRRCCPSVSALDARRKMRRLDEICYTIPTRNLQSILQLYEIFTHSRQRKSGNHIPQTHNTFRDDHRRDSAMGQHCGITTWPEVLFHPGTRRTIARPLQYRCPNLERLILQCSKVDAGNHKISPQQQRIDLSSPQNRLHNRDMLRLNQRHLPLGLPRRTAMMIAFHAARHDTSGVLRLNL